MTSPVVSRRTLLDCLSEGRLSQSVALGYAVGLAQELCKIHAAGRAHGGLSPKTITLTENGVELTPAFSTVEVTPYTAPEVLVGAPADVLSDVFSFGAVVYEMLAGRHAFEGDSRESLSAAIAESQLLTCGVAAIDHLIQTCLATDRTARFQRMEKILMELKLAAIAARLCQMPVSGPRWEPVAAHLGSELREVQRVVEQQAQLLEQQVHLLEQQAAAMDAIREDQRRTDGLLAWVVEILEVLQSNMLEQSRGARVEPVPEKSGGRFLR